MLQFYFLSVLCNALTGALLIFDSAEEKDAGEPMEEVIDVKSPFFSSPNVRLALGLLTLGVGLLKFIMVVNDSFLILADLIPAVAGLMGGFTLLFQYFVVTTTLSSSINDSLKLIFIGGKKYIGIACVIASILHFLLPGLFFI